MPNTSAGCARGLIHIVAKVSAPSRVEHARPMACFRVDLLDGVLQCLTSR
jgi:hypothetical protein